MTSDRKGSTEGKDVAPVTADYGQRAAMALDALIPAPHRDKTIARLFGISPRMAKYLRKGRHWSVSRLTQASSILGTPFDAALLSDELHISEMQEIAGRLARLESRFEELHQPEGQSASDIPPARGEAADGDGRTGAAGSASEPDRGGSPARGQGHPLAQESAQAAPVKGQRP